MREIKFRAWIDGEKSGSTLTTKDGVTLKEWMDYDIFLNPSGKILSVESGRDIQGIYEGVLMQYTGLKDKNCVDIYEGDIVKNGINIGLVIWKKESACFVFRFCNNTKEILLGCSDEYFEVIGNKFENLELLE